MDELDPHSIEPMYRQLAGILRRKIASGEYPAGRPIPSRLTLTQEYGVSHVTVAAAIDILRDEGLIETHIGKGLYVRPCDGG